MAEGDKSHDRGSRAYLQAWVFVFLRKRLGGADITGAYDGSAWYPWDPSFNTAGMGGGEALLA